MEAAIFAIAVLLAFAWGFTIGFDAGVAQERKRYL